MLNLEFLTGQSFDMKVWLLWYQKNPVFADYLVLELQDRRTIGNIKTNVLSVSCIVVGL